MAQRTRADSPTKTCTADGCGRPLRARGFCSAHYKTLRREETGRSHHVLIERTCVTCGTVWTTPRPEARFCTAKCKGAFMSERNLRTCKLPADHPVMALIEARKQAEQERREALRREAQRARFEWRTARECPGCACWFTPLHTPNAVCCSRSCSARMARRRRRAREHGARGSWTWSEFMSIARKFDYCCAYCGEKPERLDPDHVVPLSRGGYDSPSNLLPTCAMCNSSKCAMTLAEWAAWRAERGQSERATTWVIGDPRYAHLTQALLSVA